MTLSDRDITRQMERLGMIDSQVKRITKVAIVALVVLASIGAVCYFSSVLWHALTTVSDGDFRGITLLLLIFIALRGVGSVTINRNA